MIALHFDHTVFDSTTTATGGSELFTQGSDGCIVKRQAAHHSDALAGAALGFKGHAQHAVGDRPCARNAAAATGKCLTTLRTRAPNFGRVNQATLG